MTKIYLRCKIEKDSSSFTFRKDTNKDRTHCRHCNNKMKSDLLKIMFDNYEWNITTTELECTSFNKTKNIEFSPKRKDNTFGIRLTCKNCTNEYHSNYNNTRRETDYNLGLTLSLRSRVNSAFKAQSVRKRTKQ